VCNRGVYLVCRLSDTCVVCDDVLWFGWFAREGIERSFQISQGPGLGLGIGETPI
jgi:hypothetical protein